MSKTAEPRKLTMHVGQKVRVSKKFSQKKVVGQEGVIKEVTPDKAYPYRVLWNTGGSALFFEQELELAR